MKRVVVVVVALLAVATLVYADQQKIKVVTGNIPILLTVPADSTGFVVGPSWQISEMTGGSPEFNDFQWDRMFGTFWMANFTELSTDSATEGNADTLILRYTFGSADYSFIAEYDTGTIPASEQFVISRDAWADPTQTLYLNHDSVSAAYSTYPDYSVGAKATALDMDKFWIVYYATDSAGTGRLSGTLNYYLKFIKDGE